MEQEEHKDGRIPIGDVNKLIRNREQYRRALISNGWFAPGPKAPICTVVFMQEVRSGECWCPKLELTKFRACLHPPTQDKLRWLVVEEIEKKTNFNSEQERESYLRLAKHLRKNLGDTKWLLGLASTLNPDMPIFRKGFQPQKKE